ncbi:MAG: alpha/beta fold hydrolase [Nannocystaceae bacterium]|nr:alpha/beta fold hydrolase [Nannocystaceae bacterium]
MIDELAFTTLGGVQRAALQMPVETARAAVVVAPALGVRASYYRKLCGSLNALGFATAAVDLPGQGKSPVRANRRTDWGYGALIEHYASALRVLHGVMPDVPTFIVGHSIGGQVALMTAGMDIPGLSGVVVVASGCPYWRTWEGTEAYRIRAATWACGVMARSLGVFPGDKVGFGGREPKTLIVQWAHAAQTGNYAHGNFDGDALLAKPGPPTLGIRVEGDALAPERSVKLTLDRLRARDVSFERWSTAPDGGDHNRWPSEPSHVARRVSEFADGLR